MAKLTYTADGYPFVAPSDDDSDIAAAQDYLNTPRVPTTLPGFVHEYKPGWDAQLEAQRDPLVFAPAVQEGITGARRLLSGETQLASPANMLGRLAGYQETGPRNDLTGLRPIEDIERYQTWPEKLVRSGFSLPHDVVSGDVSMRDEEGRTSPELIERTQDLSGLMGGGSVAGTGTKPVGSIGVFGGAKAKTANLGKLELAKKMEADGYFSSDIWDHTGWFKGTDGQWRFEIPDNTLKVGYGTNIKPEYLEGTGVSHNANVIEHPLLFDAYPELKNLIGLVEHGHYGGSFDTANGVVKVSAKDLKDARSITAHELQHAVQNIEGFSNGASIDVMKQVAEMAVPKKIWDNLTAQQKDKVIFEAYRRNAGETEARNVQSRLDYSQNTRDVLPPDYSQDIPTSKQTVRNPWWAVVRGNMNGGVLSDTSANAPLSALAKAPRFYSALENAVKNSRTKAATAEQWLGELRNQPGVKQEELDWVLHELPTGRLTKAELEQFVNEHKVELKELQLGENDKGAAFSNAIDWFRPVVMEVKTLEDVTLAKKHNANFRETFKDWSNEELFNKIQEYKKIPYTEFHDKTKYSQWQLPGGSNYREMLLSLPKKPKKEGGQWATAKQLAELAGDDWNTLGPNGRQRYRDQAASMRIDEANYKSSHWNEPNILAHIRTNERQIPNVGNSLHIEEIQSDWHQAGRRSGYKGEREKLKPKFDDIEKKIMDSNDESILADPDLDNALKTAVNKKLITAEDASLYKRYSQIEVKVAVPDAPFKSSWADLALKRIIRQAAEEGKDAISWTPGEAQAARYDLSKHVDRLQYYPNSKKLVAHDKNGSRVVDKTNVEPKDLADIVGKEAAEKLLKTPVETRFGPGPAHDYHLLEGADLKIGGEGMRAFYDKMLVDKANAIAKKFGGKVEQSKLPGSGKPEYNIISDTTEDGAHNVKIKSNAGKHYDIDKDAGDGYYQVLEMKPDSSIVEANLNVSTGSRPETMAEVKTLLKEWEVGRKYVHEGNDPVHVLRLTPQLRDAAINKGFSLFADTGKVGAPLAALTKVEHNPFTTDAYHGAPKPFVGTSIGENLSIRQNSNNTWSIWIKSGEKENILATLKTKKLAEQKLKEHTGEGSEFYSAKNPELSGGVDNGKYGYADPTGLGNSGSVMPLKLNTKDYHTYDAKGQPWQAANDQAIFEANQLNKKGVILNNVIDNPNSSLHDFGPQTVYITLDPSTVRSRFAKFDPAKFKESGLLKSLGIPIDISNQNGQDPLIDNSHDVPYGAGASNNGFVVHVDKSIPRYDNRLGDLDLHKSLALHERAEKRLMDGGMPYEKAHKIATGIEKNFVEAQGGNWNKYEKVIDGFLSKTEKEKTPNAPPDLYLKPYAHDKKQLNKIKGNVSLKPVSHNPFVKLTPVEGNPFEPQ